MALFTMPERTCASRSSSPPSASTWMILAESSKRTGQGVLAVGVRHYGVRLGSEVYLKREMRDAQALERAMAGVVGEFEAIIREFPSQWFQFAPFWPTSAVTVNRSLGSDAATPRRKVGG